MATDSSTFVFLVIPHRSDYLITIKCHRHIKRSKNIKTYLENNIISSYGVETLKIRKIMIFFSTKCYSFLTR